MENINTEEYWNNVWEKESAKSWRRYPKTFERILQLVGRNKKILEIGCGIGILLEKLKHEENEVVGLDVSSSAIALLAKKGIKGVVSKLPVIPFEDNTFDFIISTETLEHIDEDYETIKECFRVCKKRGRLIFTVPNNTLESEYTKEHVRTYSKNSLMHLFQHFSDSITVDEFIEEFYADETIKGTRIKIALDTLIVAAIKDKEVILAKTEFNENIKKNNSRELFLRGNKEKLNGKYDDALRSYRKAGEEGYNQLLVQEAIASIYIIKKDYSKSFEIYDELVDKGSESPEVLNNLANLYVLKKEYDKALNLLKKALDYGHPNKERIIANIALLEQKIKSI